MEQTYLLSIDQGTTGTKVLLIGRSGEIAAQSYRKHTQYYPQEGWVEHDPEEIWLAVHDGVREVLANANARPQQVAGVGLANQGETVMWWDGETHRPLYPAVVWSCRRSQEIAEKWEQEGNWPSMVTEKTGLRIDPYFSGTKIRWMLDNVPAVQQASAAGSAKAGTLDSWLIWKMTSGKYHVTDTSTAARTLLFNIHKVDYDDDILSYLGIDRKWLPDIADSMQPLGSPCALGDTNPDAFLGISAPISVSLVDQPASLFGHLCVQPGAAKVTYGTGCFAYMNTGGLPPFPSIICFQPSSGARTGR
jgi:glycerol kinase